MVDLTVEGMARYKEIRIQELCDSIRSQKEIESADIDEFMEALIRVSTPSLIDKYRYLLSNPEYQYVKNRICQMEGKITEEPKATKVAEKVTV